MGKKLPQVVGDMVSGECKERRLGPNESPVAVMMLWPNNNSGQYYRYVVCCFNKSGNSNVSSIGTVCINSTGLKIFHVPKLEHLQAHWHLFPVVL